MESIVTQLYEQDTWEEYIAYRLMKGRFNWHEFYEADNFVAQGQYQQLAQKIMQGEGLGMPTKKMVNKMGSAKKRVVYSFSPEVMRALKVIAFKLYDYDHAFAPNCYAFRRGMSVHDAVRHINKAVAGRKMWAYKLDIHNYFNSISVEILLPMLQQMMADDPQLFSFFQKMLSDDRAIYNGQVVRESHGVMAGTPTSPFLANVYLKDVDKHFHDVGAVYARYSDDIIMFAPDRPTLQAYQSRMAHFLSQYHLQVNADKEKVYSPDDAYEFLGFKCQGRHIDIADAAKNKMKGKIKRAAKALLRWRNTKHIAPEKAMKGLINHFNKKFFETDDSHDLSWARWYFPIINQTDGLKEIDHYLQQNIRFLGTGRHNKANFRIPYDELKRLGYRSLVYEFYKWKSAQTI